MDDLKCFRSTSRIYSHKCRSCERVNASINMLCPPHADYNNEIEIKKRFARNQNDSKQPERNSCMWSAPECGILVWKDGLDLLTRTNTEEKENSEVDNWYDGPQGRITGLLDDTLDRIHTEGLLY